MTGVFHLEKKETTGKTHGRSSIPAAPLANIYCVFETTRRKYRRRLGLWDTRGDALRNLPLPGCSRGSSLAPMLLLKPAGHLATFWGHRGVWS